MKALRRWWAWWSRGLLVYRWVNTTLHNQIINVGRIEQPILLQPMETLEITIYPARER